MEEKYQGCKVIYVIWSLILTEIVCGASLNLNKTANEANLVGGTALCSQGAAKCFPMSVQKRMDSESSMVVEIEPENMKEEIAAEEILKQQNPSSQGFLNVKELFSVLDPTKGSSYNQLIQVQQSHLQAIKFAISKIESVTNESEKRIWQEFRDVEQNKLHLINEMIRLRKLEAQREVESQNLKKIELKFKETQDEFTKKIFQEAIRKVRQVLVKINTEIRKIRVNEKIGYLDMQNGHDGLYGNTAAHHSALIEGGVLDDPAFMEGRLAIAKFEASIQLQQERIQISMKEVSDHTLQLQRELETATLDEKFDIQKALDMESYFAFIVKKKKNSLNLKQEILELIKSQLNDLAKLNDLKQRLVLVTSQKERFEIVNTLRSLRHNLFEEARLEHNFEKLKLDIDALIIDMQRTLYIERLAQLHSQLKFTVQVQDRAELEKQIKLEKMKLQDIAKRKSNLVSIRRLLDQILLELNHPRISMAFHGVDHEGNPRKMIGGSPSVDPSPTSQAGAAQSRESPGSLKTANGQTPDYPALNLPLSPVFHKQQNSIRTLMSGELWVDD